MLKKFNKTILIAEACENHFGNIKYAKEMVVKSKKSGADFVKFQHHIPEEEMLKNSAKSDADIPGGCLRGDEQNYQGDGIDLQIL